jgi:hypothetical protein
VQRRLFLGRLCILFLFKTAKKTLFFWNCPPKKVTLLGLQGASVAGKPLGAPGYVLEQTQSTRIKAVHALIF